jgi:hypothetical protein
MTNTELAAFYRRYNACCNEHRFEDLAEFVARDVATDGTDRGDRRHRPRTLMRTPPSCEPLYARSLTIGGSCAASSSAQRR